MDVAAKLLEQNPDLYLVWNYRRRGLLQALPGLAYASFILFLFIMNEASYRVANVDLPQACCRGTAAGSGGGLHQGRHYALAEGEPHCYVCCSLLAAAVVLGVASSQAGPDMVVTSAGLASSATRIELYRRQR
jgi:hypothetical protein